LSDKKIVVSKDGPYLVSGSVPLNKEYMVPDLGHGDPVTWEQGQTFPDKEKYALCRCGKSKTPPYCDGNHAKNAFKCSDTMTRS
jgi:CDGSH-type Zn-finger protein